jgi:predicted SnoaL-like aldol condensation-catalyzing enzyme
MKPNGFVVGFALGVLTCVSFAAVKALAADDQESKNKALAVEFYQRALNRLDFQSAAELIGDRYIQHNPNAIDGPEGLKQHLAMLRKQFPQNRGEIKRALADGDLVALHVHSKRTPESRGNAIVDIFRIENGKIVEHWDVVQSVPERALNENTMF